MGMETAEPIGDHLDTGEIAAYVDQAVSAGERERMEAHLALCDACTEEVAFVVKTLDAPGEETKNRRRPWILAAAGIAAVVLAGSLLIGMPGVRGGEDRVLRDSPAADAGGAALIQVLTPAEAGDIDVGRVEFAWRAIEAGAAYNLTVTDEGGDVVWTGSTRDTAVLLTSQVVLEPGATYFWYVDAVLPDGRTLSSGVRSFTAATSG